MSTREENALRYLGCYYGYKVFRSAVSGSNDQFRSADSVIPYENLQRLRVHPYITQRFYRRLYQRLLRLI